MKGTTMRATRTRRTTASRLQNKVEQLRRQFVELVELAGRIDEVCEPDFMAADPVLAKAMDVGLEYARAMLRDQHGRI
ncbi:MAG: hypothetical protein C0467_25330 [Planctomycetaceae bacterium]|nr:hypothetical protein [Planctomycetaceae bacterium]